MGSIPIPLICGIRILAGYIALPTRGERSDSAMPHSFRQGGQVKFLCVCDGGNVRSVALAFVLHEQMNHEAIPVGRLRVSKDTMSMLCTWADVVVILQPHMDESIPKKFKNKLLCVDVGPDRYGIWIHPELLPQVQEGAKWLLAKKGSHS